MYPKSIFFRHFQEFPAFNNYHPTQSADPNRIGVAHSGAASLPLDFFGSKKNIWMKPKRHEHLVKKKSVHKKWNSKSWPSTIVTDFSDPWHLRYVLSENRSLLLILASKMLKVDQHILLIFSVNQGISGTWHWKASGFLLDVTPRLVFDNNI